MSAWTEDEDKLLETLWRDGYSGAAVANELTRAGYEPRTRNAIIGRMHRLGLSNAGRSCTAKPARIAAPKRAKPKAPVQAKVSSPLPAPSTHVEAPRVAPPIEVGPVTILDISRSRCAFPLWPDKAPPVAGVSLYCGDPVRMGHPYCPRHFKVAYQPHVVRPGKKRPASLTSGDGA